MAPAAGVPPAARDAHHRRRGPRLGGVLLAAVVVLALAPSTSSSADMDCAFLDVSCPARLRYRPVDGSCNNLLAPWLGAANTPLLRLARAEYGDGGGAPRRARRGAALPSAQRVAARLLPPADHQADATHLFVLWGQLLVHDVALSDAPKIEARGRCCDQRRADERCMQIAVPERDPFYRQFGVDCLPVERTNTSRCPGSLGEQMSLVTHFVDASFVYGSNGIATRRLRRFEGGQLVARSVGDGSGHFQDFLPLARGESVASELCGGRPCYDAGDARVNQNPMLAALQTLFLREHNRVAGALAALNPHWRDETLFQEARRVVVAEWQLLTYRDWLQGLLGPGRVRELGLVPAGPSPRSAYAADADPRTANEVTASAMRALHSMVQGAFWLGPRGARAEPLSAWLFNPVPLLERERGLDDVLLGLAYQQAQAQDRWYDTEITQQSESTRAPDGRRFGTNLAAVDIQRGRDHGLPGYARYRLRAGLPEAYHFDDLLDVLREEDVASLRELYEFVDDVDLYVGVLLERRAGGALLGPSARPLLEDQFWRWRFADRFFYNFAGFDHSLSEEQILALEAASVARLLCDHVPGLERAPRDAFRRLDYMGNEDVSCKKLRRVDFSSWKEDNYQRKKHTRRRLQ